LTQAVGLVRSALDWDAARMALRDPSSSSVGQVIGNPGWVRSMAWIGFFCISEPDVEPAGKPSGTNQEYAETHGVLFGD
jgi:hypothetical protein